MWWIPIISEHTLDIILRFLITMYWIWWITNFYVISPEFHKWDDKLFNVKSQNYLFRLTTSLIFFIYGLLEFSDPSLVYLTIAEIIIIIIIYLHLILSKKKAFREKARRLKSFQKEL